MKGKTFKSNKAQLSLASRSAVPNQRVTGLVTKRFTTLPTWEDQGPFLRDAQTLSAIAGCNPSTVTKKIPAEHPDEVSEATIKKFFDAEEQCYGANWDLGADHFLENVSLDCDGHCDLSGWFGSETVCCTENIFSLDGQTKQIIDYAVDELNRLITLPWTLSDSLPFGPGVSQLTRDRKSNNLIEKLTTSKGLWPNPDFVPNDYFTDDIAWQLWEDFDGSYVSDQINQVAKNATINRTIGVTSFVSIAAQGVCGDYIRANMRKHGIDLNRLSETHRDLAELGSRLGNLATIDFSMASDTISRGLVWVLLNNSRSSDRCRELYSKLCGCRSWYFNVDDNEHLFQKFSSMGNKFTFELESLLFTALARAIERLFHYSTPYCRKATSLGDDTIIYGLDRFLSMDKERIVQVYGRLGLTVNPEKSFFTGPFRESCGADYLDGTYVRGFYHKSRTVTLRDVVRMINHFTCYYGLSLITILHHCPFVREVFLRQSLHKICYKSDQFVDQLATLPVHAIGAIDTFLVVDRMSYEYFECEGGSLLSYEVKDPLKWVFKPFYDHKRHCRSVKHLFIFDGHVERIVRRKTREVLDNLDRLGYILAQQSATSNRRLAQRWESCVLFDRLGLPWYDNRELPPVDGELEVPAANVWITCPPTGIRVRFRAYNPAWPIELPLRQQEWS